MLLSPGNRIAGLKTVASPLLSVPAGGSYHASKGYDDPSMSSWLISLYITTFPVPIYDGRVRKGRRGFMFMDSDFRRLTSMPLYRRPPCEVPLGSIVTVGYTLSTYNGNSGPVLSSNLQFIILLTSP